MTNLCVLSSESKIVIGTILVFAPRKQVRSRNGSGGRPVQHRQQVVQVLHGGSKWLDCLACFIEPTLSHERSKQDYREKLSGHVTQRFLQITYFRLREVQFLAGVGKGEQNLDGSISGVPQRRRSKR